MSRCHQPGRRTRHRTVNEEGIVVFDEGLANDSARAVADEIRKRGTKARKRRNLPEIIVLAPRQPPQDAPAPDDEAREVPAPERERDRRREVLADQIEEARRWR